MRGPESISPYCVPAKAEEPYLKVLGEIIQPSEVLFFSPSAVLS